VTKAVNRTSLMGNVSIAHFKRLLAITWRRFNEKHWDQKSERRNSYV